MSPLFFRRFVLTGSCAIALAACSGGSTGVSPVAGSSNTGASQGSPLGTMSLASGAKPASVTVDNETANLRFTSAGSPNASLSVAAVSGRNVRDAVAGSSCANYTPPVFNLTNSSSQPIVITSRDFAYAAYLFLPVPCNVVGDGYNVALTQTQPTALASVTVGDVIGFGIANRFYAIGKFVERPNATYTFAPNSTTQLSLVPAAVNPATGYPYSNSEATTFPPNQQTTLGSVPTASCSTATGSTPGCPNGSATQTTVSVDPQSSSGGSASVSCFNTTDPRFAAIPPASITAFPGTVKGACEFNTGSGAVTLATTVTFTIADPDPDTAHGALEGPYLQVPCTQTTSGDTITATCPTTGPNGDGFTVGPDSATQYQYFLFGNDPYPVTLSINLVQPYTDSGLAVTAGQPITVTASGTLYWRGPSCTQCTTTPAGQPVADCQQYVPPEFTAPALPCWSLIGKIGATGTPFAVGTSFTSTATTSGELYLGVNDNYYPDNTGSWTAQITL